MIEYANLRTFLMALLLCLLFISVTTEIREVVFYSKNNWDFRKQSQIGNKNIYKGDSTNAKDIVSNIDRVLIARPIFIVTEAVFLVGILLSFR